MVYGASSSSSPPSFFSCAARWLLLSSLPLHLLLLLRPARLMRVPVVGGGHAGASAAEALAFVGAFIDRCRGT
jgi:hypothetical protein